MVVTHANMVLEIDESNTKALYRRAMAYMNINQLDQGKADITKAIKLDPSNRPFRDLL
jgi:Tfp pilus assembly protein PilF